MQTEENAQRHTYRRPMLTGGAILACVVVILALPNITSRMAYAIESGKSDAARQDLHYASELSDAFENVATTLRPSVVSIYTVRNGNANATHEVPLSQLPEPFRQFFGNDPHGQFFFRSGPESSEPTRGLGSGVIVSKDGYILTNNHVVDHADKISVRLSDDRNFDAKVVGTDPKTDLAVLKIDTTGLKPAQLGNSDALRVGEWVVAMGCPFQLSHTVTAGIVSATGRSYVGIADYEDFIQTDAAINPGNSGGPLANLEGDVIGINTAIATKTGVYNGVGFAVPSSMAKTIMERLIKDGEVRRGYLGVMIQELTPELASSFEYTGKHGVLVGQVLDDGPADDAGLQSGDIIVSVNSEPAKSVAEVRNQIAATLPGKRVPLEVIRDGREFEVNVKIGKLSDEPRVAMNGENGDHGLGLEVENLTPQISDRLGYDTTSGVVVTQVEPAGAAENSGLRAGDVILKVGKERVTSVRDFKHAIADADLDHGVRLRVQSQGGQRFVFLKR